MNRDDFPRRTKDAVAKRAAYYCSNPKCNKLCIGPAEKNIEDVNYYGKIAHITAASEGGPRYDKNLNSLERKSANNAIFLCSNCADMIDKNEGIDYPKEKLHKWKTSHEERIKSGEFNKHYMKIEEVVNLIEAKKNGIKTMEQKKLEVTISEPIMLDTNKRYIQLKAINKGVRPITIIGYGMRSIKYGTFIEGYLKKLVRKKLAHPIPTKLSDGDAFFALYPRKYIESMIKSHGLWEYPFELECYFKTNDGIFFSKKSTKLIDLSKYDEKIKNIKFTAKKD